MVRFGNSPVRKFQDTIMEYDISGDSIRKIGNMREEHAYLAVRVVKSADFSQWLWCP